MKTSDIVSLRCIVENVLASNAKWIFNVDLAAAILFFAASFTHSANEYQEVKSGPSAGSKKRAGEATQLHVTTMRPTLNLHFRNGPRDLQMALHSPMQGFDSLRIISQMISLQCLHYLILSLVLPILLATLSLNRSALHYQGGAVSLSMILDWRELAGHPTINSGRAWPWGDTRKKSIVTVPQMDYLDRAGLLTSSREDMGGLNKWWEWDLYLKADSLHWIKEHDEGIAWDRKSVGKGTARQSFSSNPASGNEMKNDAPIWWNAFAKDSSRGWIIVLAWALTGAVDVFLLSTLIRRPTHILDHTLTLHFFHLLLTTFYTRYIPTSLFYWLVMLAHAGACVVWAEALSIRRELQTTWMPDLEHAEGSGEGQGDEERARLLASDETPSMRQTNGKRAVTTHVLFEGDEDDEDLDKEDKGDSKGKNGMNGHRHESIEMKRLT